MYRKYKKLIDSLLILIIFIAITIIIKNYFKPFLGIVVLLIFSTPIYNFMCRYRLFSNRFNAIITIIFINTLFFIIVIYSGNIVFEKVKYIFTYFLSSFNLNIDKIEVGNYFKFNDIIEKIKLSFFSNSYNILVQKGAVYTTDSIFSYFISNISVYFILVDKYVIVNSAERLLTKEKIMLIEKKVQDVKKMISIEVKLVLLTTVQTIFGFAILEVNSAIFLGMLCGVLDILPYVGTILVFLPLIIYKIYLKQYIIAAGLIFLYLLLQFNRQIMETKFMSTKLQIHPLMLIIAIYVGGKIFGLIGFIIAPIYVLTVKEIIFS